MKNNFHPPTDIERELRAFFVCSRGKKIGPDAGFPPEGAIGIRICGWSDTVVLPFPILENGVENAVYFCMGTEHLERYDTETTDEWVQEIYDWSRPDLYGKVDGLLDRSV